MLQAVPDPSEEILKAIAFLAWLSVNEVSEFSESV